MAQISGLSSLSGGLQSGGLQSGGTDLGSDSPLHGLRAYSLVAPISDLIAHTPVLKKIMEDPIMQALFREICKIANMTNMHNCKHCTSQICKFANKNAKLQHCKMSFCNNCKYAKL